MTREEQINAAQPYSGVNHEHPNELHTANKWFAKGAKWADSHPNWHKYPEEKPSAIGEKYIAYFKLPNSKGVITAMYYGGDKYATWYDVEGDGMLLDDEDIVAWTELPYFNEND